MSRVAWDEYFMLLAEQAAKRSTCSRLQVGAVIVQNRQVMSTGYNGAPRGLSHCIHMTDTPCYKSVHAEANALIFAGSLPQCYLREMYITHAPCYDCSKLIINAGIDKVMYRDTYRSVTGLDLLEEAEVEVVRLSR
jgi:dCMP deaminase